jgi:hypothetical protein
MAKLIKKGKERKPSMRKGNPPRLRTFPNRKVVAKFTDNSDDRDYDLWHTKSQFDADDIRWSNFKLVCPQRTRKSNYWFGWNGKRLASMGDHRILEEHHPDLYADVVRFLTKNYKWSTR